MKTPSLLSGTIVATFFLANIARAADITWGTANTITGDAGIAVKNYQADNNVTQNTTNGTADIQSTGTSFFAMNFTGVPGDSWTNRVTFFESTPQQTIFWSANEPGALTQNGVTLAFGPGWSGNTRIYGNSPQGGAYGSVVGYTWDTLSYMRYMNNTTGSLTFSGLTIGQEYAVQYWVQDSRSDGLTRTLTLDGQTVLDYNNESGVGQWAVGTFTADGTSQTINITANASVQVNMLQLRALLASFTAADGVWSGGSGNWSTAANWDASTIGQGIDKSATFNGLDPVTAAVDVIRPIGALLFSGANHTLSNGTGSLMLDGDTTYTPPAIDVASGFTATIGALLTGNEGMSKTGTGTLVLSGSRTYTGTTDVTEGTLQYQGGSYSTGLHSIATDAVLDFNVLSGSYDGASTKFSGAGTLRKTGAGALAWDATIATFALDPGAQIDVQGGTFTAGSYANESWAGNYSDLNVASGATFNTVEANVRVNKITGLGTIATGLSGAGYQNLTIGVDNGSSSFGGVITDSLAPGNLVKTGTETITLDGLNTYTGNTGIANGTLAVSSTGGLRFRPTTNGATNKVSGSATPPATSSLSFLGTVDLDLGAVDKTAGNTWNLFNLGSFTRRPS